MRKTISFKEKPGVFPAPIEFTYESSDGELRNGQYGFGSVKYAEGSIYTGSLIYVDGVLEKYGFGEQNFENSTITAEGFTADKNLKLLKFVGFYDFFETNWIFGNGVFYFTDKKGRPAAFIKGRFAGTGKIAEWDNFSSDMLLPGYTLDMEIEFTPQAGRFLWLENSIKHGVKCKTVLVGDSWFELYECPIDGKYICGTFAEDTKNKNVLNLGIGGSKFIDWTTCHGKLLKYVDFDRIIINLGFNDVHSSIPTSSIVEHTRKLFDMIRERNANAEIYLLNITPSVTYKLKLTQEREANAALEKLCNEYNITVLDSAKLFMPNGEYIMDFESYYYADGLHLDRKGYELWRKLFIELF